MGRGSSFKKDIEQMTPSKEAIIEKDSEATPEGWYFCFGLIVVIRWHVYYCKLLFVVVQ